MYKTTRKCENIIKQNRKQSKKFNKCDRILELEVNSRKIFFKAILKNVRENQEREF